MKKAPNAQIYFGMAGLMFVGTIGFLFHQNQGLDSKRADVAQMREQSKEQRDIYKKLDASKVELTDLRTKLAHLEQGVPDAAYVPTMLKDLEMAGKQHGIEVTGVRPMPIKAQTPGKDKDAVEQKPYQPLDLELKGRGDYSDLLNFIQALNVFPKIVAVRTVGLTPVANGPKEHNHHLEISIGLRAFVFKQPPTPPTPPTPTKPAGRPA